MDYDKLKKILDTLDNKRNEFAKLIDIENKTKVRTSYWVGIESLQLEFSKSEVSQILDEKKKSLEKEIRGLAKELSEVNDD
ncbi:MAG: hypothetical protein ABF477_03820 [Leuconostoc pseudomesenteroides]|uniref:hypothetical protein n=1 Tax=Leuconostoc pseudomesenteroides TaxID=33968 RepID=UPI0039E8E8E7